MRRNVNTLVVDDERSMRDLLKQILEKEGYRVTLAAGGEEALSMLGEKRFDIMLSDLRMPRMDGFTLLKKVKQHYPDTAVVVMTGYSETYSVNEAFCMGADEYITKPFKVNEVSMMVERARWHMFSTRNRRQVEKHLSA